MMKTTMGLAGLALLLAGCSALPLAQIDTPPALKDSAWLTLPAAHGRSGAFALPAALGGDAVRYVRGADRLSLFDSVALDRASLTLTIDPGAIQYRCDLRRTAVQAGVAALPVRPMQLRCQDASGQRELLLGEQQRATRSEREGRFRDGALALDIRPVHRVQGSPLPLEQPGGYLLIRDGRVLAAVDLLGGQPRLRSVAAGAAERAAVRDAALLLALHWDPQSL